MTQYRIEWRLLKYSRISCHGDWHGHDSKKFLEQNVEFLNKEHRGEIHHWIATRLSLKSGHHEFNVWRRQSTWFPSGLRLRSLTV